MTLRTDLPLLDLHVHLRGTITPSMAMKLAARNGIPVPSGYIAGDGYVWTDFFDFLNVYDQVGRVVRTADDLNEVATAYLEQATAEGTRYVEFMLSPAHSEENGIPFHRQMEAVSAAFDCARRATGIEGGLIVTCVRHRGPDEARDLAETVAANLSPSVIGFGLTGNEHKFDAAEFAGAFQVAGEAGLGLTAHSGEWRDARSVLHTVETLNVSRVGHGIRSAEDPSVLRELADRGIGFEVCLSSNLALLASDVNGHPLKRMLEMGCRVALATDDPAFFRTSPAREFLTGRDVFGLSDAQMLTITQNSIDIAFCSVEVKDRLRALLVRGES